MTFSGPALPAARNVPKTALTVYGCGPDEAALFRDLAPRFGVTPTITAAAVSTVNVDLALGKRCISVGHKAPVTNATLQALSQAGVRYLSTRSIGYNHLDLEFAEHVGITVGNVAYSPDSVADFTLMLILMLIRNAKTVLRRADIHDYRLPEVRGKELRDLTVGVIGTGRIGSAVVARLKGFGCRVLAHDPKPRTSALYLPLDELLHRSDVVTLHAPLDAGTYHLIDRARVDRMRQGAFIVNTGRGALIDTDAVIPALESGRLGGAALDVVEGEEGIFYADYTSKSLDGHPLARLGRLPHVLISPHTAYYTQHALDDTVENTIVNCLNFERELTSWEG